MLVILVISLVCVMVNLLLLSPKFDIITRNPTLDRIMLVILWYNLGLDLASNLLKALYD